MSVQSMFNTELMSQYIIKLKDDINFGFDRYSKETRNGSLKHCGVWDPKYGTFYQVISSYLPIVSCSKQIPNRGSRIIVHVDYASPTLKA